MHSNVSCFCCTTKMLSVSEVRTYPLTRDCSKHLLEGGSQNSRCHESHRRIKSLDLAMASLADDATPYPLPRTLPRQRVLRSTSFGCRN